MGSSGVMKRLLTMKMTWRKLSIRLATPSLLQSTREVLSNTTRREFTMILSALKENSTTPFWLWATTKLLLSPTGLSRTRGERAGVRYGYIHMKMGENNCGLAKRPVYPVLD